MKLSASKVESWVRAFHGDKAPALILLYGSDAGAIRELSETLAKAYLGNMANETQRTDLNEDDVKASPAVLLDEAASASMFGGADGRRLVSLRGGGEATAKAVSEALSNPPPNALILIEAGSLTPAAKLRKIVEASDDAMALPCFPLDGAVLGRLIRDYLETHGLTIDASALSILADCMGEDRGVMMRELERLVLYLHPRQDAQKKPRLIEMGDIEAALGDRSSARIDRLADAVAGGDLNATDIVLNQLKQAGTSADNALPLLRRHFQMLHLALGLCEGGQSVNAALTAAAKPPLHFKRRPLVERQMRLWTRRKAARALSILHETEANCRQSGAGFIEAQAAYTLLRLTRAAGVKG